MLLKVTEIYMICIYFFLLHYSGSQHLKKVIFPPKNSKTVKKSCSQPYKEINEKRSNFLDSHPKQRKIFQRTAKIKSYIYMYIEQKLKYDNR